MRINTLGGVVVGGWNDFHPVPHYHLRLESDWFSPVEALLSEWDAERLGRGLALGDGWIKTTPESKTVMWRRGREPELLLGVAESFTVPTWHVMGVSLPLWPHHVEDVIESLAVGVEALRAG